MKNKCLNLLLILGLITCSEKVNAQWSLTGNAGTTPGTNFLGTTDAKSLYFKTNNSTKMVITSSGGKVGIGTSSPKSKLHVAGSVLFNGGTGGVPVTGAGTRMMWMPDLAAFRAGSVSSGLWDSPGIGSVAFGHNNLASGNYSSALGFTNLAFGNNTFVAGDHCSASGQSAVATGSFSNAGGDFSTALGYRTGAPTFCETTIGSNNTSYTPNDPGGFDPFDRLFTIGNGTQGSPSNAMVVLKSGNVGIGTSTPSIKLEVEQTITGFPAGRFAGTGEATALLGQVLPTGVNGYSVGVEGLASKIGVRGQAEGAASTEDGYGVYGEGRGEFGNRYGVYGVANNGSPGSLISGRRIGIYGTATGGDTAWAGYFGNGNVFIQNRLGIGKLAPGGQLELSLDQGRKPSTSTWTIVSDARLKNIDGEYTKGLKEIMQLQPLTYHYKNAEGRSFDEQVLAAEAIGFTAQEVQKIFPECVNKDEDGYLNLNIHAILIAQVNAIKELGQQNEMKDAKIESMQQQLNDLQQCIAEICNAAAEKYAAPSVGSEDRLFQNQPNPASRETQIHYLISGKDKVANISLRDINGNLIRQYPIRHSGPGQILVQANELAQGTYVYSLEIDGRSIDTKLMVVTK
ncbi:MAG: tail fiber domain-containing protein [Bacteroidetes bacterium]|nr:tail fiber domain-containing protein [Bacteroidota bacterium]